MGVQDWDETPEEKHARIDKILAINSRKPLTCISCGEIITDQQTAVSTPHGYYHDYPMTCVEGREDRDIPWHQK